MQYSSTYDFVSASTPTSRAFGELFDALVRRLHVPLLSQ
jgi:hypothetical protein